MVRLGTHSVSTEYQDAAELASRVAAFWAALGRGQRDEMERVLGEIYPPPRSPLKSGWGVHILGELLGQIFTPFYVLLITEGKCPPREIRLGYSNY